MTAESTETLSRQDETLDPLSRRLYLIQHQHGHKATSDDVLLAGFGFKACPNATRALDLGSGKGTVALLCLSVFPQLDRVIGLEAVLSAHLLARRNAALNHFENQYLPILEDLRDSKTLAQEPPFDLILGAPPFMPLGTGIMPKDPERAAGRFELRGGIEDYALCAAKHLKEDGRTVLLMDGQGEARAERALNDAGLRILEQVQICPRPNAAPTYSLFVATLQKSAPQNAIHTVFCMRNASGDEWSPEYAALRQSLDLIEHP